MKTFIQYLQETGRYNEGLEGLLSRNRGRRPVVNPQAPPATPVNPSPMDKLQALRQQALSNFSPDEERPQDEREARYLNSMRRAKKA
jgi:hypothetical protein